MKTYMHEMIWCQMHGLDDIPKGYYVAHRNGDGLDNRSDNLLLERGDRPGPCEMYAATDSVVDPQDP